MKKNGLKKKSLTLAAAVVSALEIGSVAGNVGLPMANVAEAADVHVLTDDEIAERGYPKVAGLKYFSDGTVEYSYVRQQPYSYSVRVGTHDSYDDMPVSKIEHVSVTAKGKIIGFDGNSLVTKTTEVVNIGTDYHNSHNSDWQNSQHKEVHRPKQTEIYHAFNEKGRVCSASNVDVGSVDTLQPTQDVCAAAFKSWKDHFIQGTDGTNRVSGNGGVIYAPNSTTTVEDVQKHIKNLGIDVNDQTIKMKKEIEAESNISANGKITATGDIEAGGDATVHGSETIDGDSTIHGNQTVDKDQHIQGNQEIGKNQTVHGDQTVDGDSRIHGNQTIDKDLSVYGDTDMKGDLRVENNARILGDTQLGDDKNKDKFDVWAKTHLHGDTTVGDDANDKFVVNATSEFKADATFDKNLHVKGDGEIDGNLITHGDHIIKGDTYMKGDSYVRGNVEVDENAHIKGNGLVDGDFEVKGSTKLGDDKKNDVLDVNAKTNLHGDTTIGDDENDKLVINATTDFASNATFGKNVHIKGSLETDGDSHTHGSSEVDGDSTTHGNYRVDKNLSVGGDADIEKNLHVGGDAVVDGDIYGRSFNVGNEKYIDKDGINANNHKIRNVADGDIGPDSLDAVNGRQLWNTREALQHNINQVGAGSAAMANLHPLEFEHNDKVSVSAAVGNYKDQTAFAAGVYVRPDTKSLISFSGTLGYGENMLGVGFSKKFGKHTDFENMTDEQLKDALAKLSEDAKDIREQNKSLHEKNKALEAGNKELSEKLAQNSKDDAALKASTDKQIEKLTNDNAGLKTKLSDMSKDYESRLSIMSKAYDALQSKVDSLMEKLKNLGAPAK